MLLVVAFRDAGAATMDRDTAGDFAPPLTPFAVPIRRARELLAGKAVSEIYALAGRGRLELLKDESYMRSLPPAKIKPYTRRAAKQAAA
jgi:hypothetical protein